MKDMQLDTNKLPLGCLKIERIKKSLQILNKIQKQLQIGGTLTSTVEAKISELTAEYYQTLPYDFGIVKPPKIDHILRIKDRVRQMDLLNDIYNMEQCLIKATVIYNFATIIFFVQYDLQQGDAKTVLARELLANMIAVPTDSIMYKAILTSIKNTHSQANHHF